MVNTTICDHFDASNHGTKVDPVTCALVSRRDGAYDDAPSIQCAGTTALEGFPQAVFPTMTRDSESDGILVRDVWG